jgi:hypothetical protein
MGLVEIVVCLFSQKHSRPDLTTDGTLAGAEDSDYYTPEDTQTTILSPLCSEKVS